MGLNREIKNELAKIPRLEAQYIAQSEKNTALRKLLDEKDDRITELEADNAALKAALKRADPDEMDISRCPLCHSSDHTFSNNGPNRCNDCNHQWVP